MKKPTRPAIVAISSEEIQLADLRDRMAGAKPLPATPQPGTDPTPGVLRALSQINKGVPRG